jgi:HlyD family secretion protein
MTRVALNVATMSDTSALSRNSASTQDAVTRLERELASQARNRWLWRIAIPIGVVLAWFGYRAWSKAHEPPPKARFVEVPIEPRSVVQLVESTGRLKPLTEVQVGAQVSGRVVRVLVDFNSKVRKGDLLAEIDPQLFGAQVGQVNSQLEVAKANIERARSRVQVTQLDLERITNLSHEGIASRGELDQARSTYDVAVAELAAAQANISGLRSQLLSARTTLEYTKIHSPIDGVVVNRSIEPGQTVAANFAAPVLFVIAQDLSKMQVLADIDEADVGKLAEQMPAKISVDAFLGEHFQGRVTQIRYSPNEVQGVVTYSAVIDVDNPELKLRPGMTATVAVTTKEAKDVPAVRNAALRFKPEGENLDLQPLQFGQGRVFQVSGGAVGSEEVTAKVVSIGITDGVWTQVTSGLENGNEVVTEQLDKEVKKRKFMGLF